MLTKAELRRIRLHDLRHTFATRLIVSGDSLAYMKEQMSHSSIQVTADIYHRYVQGSNKQIVDRLDEPVDNPKTEVASTIAVTRKKWVRWKRSGVHQNLLKTM